jgi:hypothetical protein
MRLVNYFSRCFPGGWGGGVPFKFVSSCEKLQFVILAIAELPANLQLHLTSILCEHCALTSVFQV